MVFGMKGIVMGLAAVLLMGAPLRGEEVEALEKRAEAYDIFKKAEDRLRVLTMARTKQLDPKDKGQWDLLMKDVKAGYARCLALYPDYADACEALHRCLQLEEGAKPSEERMDYLKRALEIDPARFWVYLSLAGDHLALGQLEEAQALARRVGKIHPPTEEKIRLIIESASFMEKEKDGVR
jgi:tetratricopeptide (TPR) repeat protein